MPGTFASICGILLFLAVGYNAAIYLALTLLLTALGFFCSGRAENEVFRRKDAKYIVIDEVSGMLISLAFLPFYDFRIIFAAFVLFRIFDTVKVFPAGRMQGLKGSLGIMSDDLIAAFYTNIILQVVLRSASFKA